MQFVQEHLGTILFTLFVVLGFSGYAGKASSFIQKLEDWYDWARAEAKERKLWKIANSAYNYVDNAHALAKKTETKIDDEFVNKAEAGLKYAIKAMKIMGLDPSDEEKDLIKMHFDAIHEAERKAKEARGVIPLVPLADEANS